MGPGSWCPPGRLLSARVLHFWYLLGAYRAPPYTVLSLPPRPVPTLSTAQDLQLEQNPYPLLLGQRPSMEKEQMDKNQPRAASLPFPPPLRGPGRPRRASPLCRREKEAWSGGMFPSQGPSRESGQPRPPSAHSQALPPPVMDSGTLLLPVTRTTGRGSSLGRKAELRGMLPTLPGNECALPLRRPPGGPSLLCPSQESSASVS